MRKSVIRYLAAAVALALACGVFAVLGSDPDAVRYHQHEEEPGEPDLGTCQKCEGKDTLCTHLPLITVNTGGKKIPGAPILNEKGVTQGYEKAENGAEEIQVEVNIIDKKGIWHHPADRPDMTAQAMLRIRGNTSRNFRKPNYKITLIDRDDPQQEKNLPLLGMDSASEWALHGPYLDKTLIRNYMWMNLSAEIMNDAPDVRFCELVLDGEYRGVYLLTELIHEGTGGVDLTDYEEGDHVFSYIARIEPEEIYASEIQRRRELDNFTHYTGRMEEEAHMELIYPGLKYQTKEVKNYVETDLNEIERRLYSRDMEQDPDSCWEYLDLPSFADYYILQEFLGINDAFYASTYFYKDVRGKLHMGPVWDYNNALGNYLRQIPETEFFLSQKGWYGQLMKSRKFVDYVTERYKNLRKGLLSDASLKRYARETIDWLGSAVERNFDVWGYSFDVTRLTALEKQRHAFGSDTPEEQLNPASYEEAVEMMLEYAKKRGRWMDRQLPTLYQYCHPSRNANSRID